MHGAPRGVQVEKTTNETFQSAERSLQGPHLRRTSLGCSSRIFRILTNQIKEENRFMKASHKILNSHWSPQIVQQV